MHYQGINNKSKNLSFQRIYKTRTEWVIVENVAHWESASDRKERLPAGSLHLIGSLIYLPEGITTKAGRKSWTRRLWKSKLKAQRLLP